MPTRKPAWWQIYLLIPLMASLLVLEHMRPIPGISEEIVVGAIVVLIFASMSAWVYVNGALLQWYEANKNRSSYELKITEYEPASKPEADGGASDERRQFGLSRTRPSTPSKYSIQLKEEDKWSLN